MLGNCFDPGADVEISQHCRPHWSQSGSVIFITFRTFDSIPKEVIARWECEKREWFERIGIEARSKHSSELIGLLSERDRANFHRTFSRLREDLLDTCQGECVLRHPDLAEIVAQSLLHFDGSRYKMGDFVVMPDHVHLLAVFGTAESMVEQCDSWLHYTAFQINRTLGRQGKFWQQEPFDHLVRSLEQYTYLRRYIEANPAKANLQVGDFYYRRYEG